MASQIKLKSKSKKIPKSKKEKPKLTLEQSLWETAEQLRGTVEVSQYKYIALGLMFLKFISDRFEERRKEISDSCKSEKKREFLIEDDDSYTEKGVFYLKKGSRWSDLMKAATQKNLGIKIDQMFRDIEQTNTVLTGVFPQVFASSNIANENLTELVNMFSKIGFGTKEKLDLDSFGRAYEFFIKKFAMNEGRRGGQFYTPKSVVQLLVEILEPYQGIIFDPTCGSGGMFVQSHKFIEAHKGKKEDVSIYGQEVIDGIWRICKMNLALRGIDSSNTFLGDSLKNNKFPSNKKANFVMANPPFNYKEWGHNQLKTDKRWVYGTPSDSKPGGNYAFMQHMLYHLDEKNGRMGLVLANGSMSTGGVEGKIREKIVEADLVDCMIAMPTNLFFTVTISVCIWFFAKNKANRRFKARKCETLFIDARKIFTPISRVQNDLTDDQIEKIAGTYRSYVGEKGYPKYKDVPGFCKVATKEEIAKFGYVLTPGRYVGAEYVEEDDEPFEEKMKKLTKEYGRLVEKSKELDKQIRKNLKDLGFEI